MQAQRIHNGGDEKGDAKCVQEENQDAKIHVKESLAEQLTEAMSNLARVHEAVILELQIFNDEQRQLGLPCGDVSAHAQIERTDTECLDSLSTKQLVDYCSELVTELATDTVSNTCSPIPEQQLGIKFPATDDGLQEPPTDNAVVEAASTKDGSPTPPRANQCRMISSWDLQEDLQRVNSKAQVSRWHVGDSYAAEAARGNGAYVEKKTTNGTVQVSQPLLTQIVRSDRFDALIAIVIVLNGVLTGLEVELGQDGPVWLMVLKYLVFVIFVMELAMRIHVFGWHFFTAFDRAWNYFDLICVLLTLPDILFDFFPMSRDASIFVIIRVVRAVRIVRILRLVKLLKHLRSMVVAILNTLPALFWSVVLILLLNYMFAICLADAAKAMLQSPEASNEALSEMFGSLPTAMYTLFQCGTGGMDWGEAAAAIANLSPIFSGLLILHQSVIIFALMNVITGIFCSESLDVAQADKDQLISQQLKDKQTYINTFQDLFNEMDVDKSGEISLSELEEFLEDPRLQAYFEFLNIHASQAWSIFRLLDTDSTGQLTVSEFVTGLLGIRGQAKCIDVRGIQHDIKHEQYVLSKFMEFTDQRFSDLENLLLQRASA